MSTFNRSRVSLAELFENIIRATSTAAQKMRPPFLISLKAMTLYLVMKSSSVKSCSILSATPSSSVTKVL